MHSPTLSYGFAYDDYHFIRPYAAAELARAFHATWDPSGIEPRFYRPLTIAFHAARFAAFGLNAHAYHVLSLCLCAAAALAMGAFVWLASRRRAAGAVACLAFVVHPSLAIAGVAWVMNQMHLLEAIVIFAGLTWWFLVRRRSAAWWTPLLGFQVTAMLINEDGILLLPAIAILHATRRRMLEPDLPRVPRAVMVTIAAVAFAVFAVRTLVLGGIGGYGHLTLARVGREPLTLASQALFYQLDSLAGVFGLSEGLLRWPPAASAFAALLVAAGIACWRRADPTSRYLMVSGVLLTLLFDLPMMFGTKPQQLHLIAAGTAILFTGSAMAMLDGARTRALRTPVALLLIAGAIVMAFASRTLGARYAPFSSDVLATDEKVIGWESMPAELREYLRRKPGAGPAGVSANPASLDAVTFRVAADRLDIYVTRGATAVDVLLRRGPEEIAGSARVEIRADGVASTIELPAGAWRPVRLPLVPASASRIGRMHRLVITSAHGAIASSAVVVH